MKSLIINTLACCAFLLPITQAQAAGAGSTFGGFTPKQTFSLKVNYVGAGTIVGDKITKGPVPTGLPKFKTNQIVKFTIGAKGQLTGPGFSIPFKKNASTAAENNYNNFPLGDKQAPNGAVVFKNSGPDKNGAPSGATVVLSKNTVKGTTMTTGTVTYGFYNDKK
jgi:hypothetical protein